MNLSIQPEQEPSTLQSSSNCSINVPLTQPGTQIGGYSDKRTFFQTTKKAHRNSHSKKKLKFFATKNEKEQVENEEKTEKKRRTVPDNYLHLLIEAADKLMENGNITMDYLNSKTLPKLYFDLDYDKFSDEEESEKYTKKCENRMCAVNVENELDLINARFTHSNSYKYENLKLCEKCYEAYKLENYCFYCNAIYRNFQFNEQYYDRKKWILCEYCEKWQHMQCEEKKGVYKNIEKLALDKNFKYMCPFCRNENNILLKQQIKFDRGKLILFNLYYRKTKGKFYYTTGTVRVIQKNKKQRSETNN